MSDVTMCSEVKDIFPVLTAIAEGHRTYGVGNRFIVVEDEADSLVLDVVTALNNLKAMVELGEQLKKWEPL